MLMINATALRPSMNGAAAPPASGGDPAGFASLLRQTRAAPAPASPSAPTEPAPSAADATQACDTPAPAEAPAAQEPHEPHEPQESDPARRTRALSKNPLHTGDAAGPTRRAAPRADPATAAPRETRPAESPTGVPAPYPGAVEPTLDPGVTHWLAALQHAPAAPHATGRSADAAPVDRAAETAPDTADSGRARARSGGPGPAELKADADTTDEAAAQSRAALADASRAGRFATALAEHEPREKTLATPTSAATGATDTTALNAAALAAAPRGAAELAAPAAVSVAAPVGAPDFAHELGLKLSVLARDGVQQAELHLNPADMGPVSVQIVMDGTQARIDFGADMAATRRAIEAGLPELASALRDAGFTLAGGGVSQHAGGRGGGGDANAGGDPGRRRNADESTVQRVGAAARRIVTAGGVDLFA